MTDSTQNLAMHSVPTLSERFWRKIGFRYHLGDEPEDAKALAGWIRTDMRLHFGWLDRLRLMLTGKLFIASIVSTDTPSPAICETRMDWLILPPGGDWR